MPKSRPTILIVSEIPLFPTNSGTRARILELIRSLRAFGFRVVLITRKSVGVRAWLRTRRCVDRVITVRGGSSFHGVATDFDTSAYREVLREACVRYDARAVIAVYIWQAPCLDVVPDHVVKVIDTHDLMYVRRALYEAENLDPWCICTREEEVSLLEKADIILAIQENERRAFAALVPDRTVVCLSHAPAIVQANRSRRVAGDRVIFVGGASPANIAGLTAFAEMGWPRIREAVVGAEFAVYGRASKHVARDLPGVTAIGYVRDLRAAYSSAAVVVNPVQLGTGINIKTVEALCAGKALVTSPFGAEGLTPAPDEAYLVRRGMLEFSDAVIRLLRDREYRSRLETRAIEFANKTFGRQAVFAEFLGVLEEHAQGS